MWSGSADIVGHKAGIYVRVSTTEQADKGYGMDVQKKRCKGMCMAKGWDVVRIFEDAGVSGTLDETKRGGLSSLMDEAYSHNIDVVVVNSLDRLGRSTSLVLRLVESLNKAGVCLVSCKESLDTSTPTGKFTLTIFAALAQLERDTIVDRTTAGREERALIDGDRGGRVPLGYGRTDRGITIIDEEADTVRYIFELRELGCSYRCIADALNRFQTRSRRGGIWYASSVRQIVINEEKYRGDFRGKSNMRWPTILG